MMSMLSSLLAWVYDFLIFFGLVESTENVGNELIVSEVKSESTPKLTFRNACAKGNLKLVKAYLAQQGFDMNMGNNYTGFHLACAFDQLNVVEFLVEQGIDMNGVTENGGYTGFHLACSRGSLNVVEFLVQRNFDMNTVDDNGLTGFYCACSHGHLNVVQFLVEKNCDMNGCKYGYTVFHVACSNGHLNVVKFLLQEGFDMNIVSNHGHTGFFEACHSQKLNVLQFLLQKGFEGINQRYFNPMNSIEMTGLEMIIQRQCDVSTDEYRIPCILCLIEAGAQCNINDDYVEGITLALHVQNRIIEITLMRETIFENCTGRIAQAITEFTMESFTTTSLQNLAQFLDSISCNCS